ncbi:MULTISPECIES: hypothetical protein [Kitasatospora]|uniref:Uncharacterized protein n=1 Tax=Kitasatospora setae (strain ATCC 33774 / DSM 43861 / JCM 3304 / KCC A-0304 / NBRC 14216 / KM-6054) TaxID=452652 RepID=E4NIY0_KITSK|nr:MULTISPECIES: hypothetical protein [Kitasatospora]BAJ32928.1 hypothetical protein KSE_71720 [Kitasatospora setae KM-6054]
MPISTLLLGVCPGPPQCTATHTYLFVDGLDLISRSNVNARGAVPGRLLRPGGQLWPTDRARTVDVMEAGRGRKWVRQSGSGGGWWSGAD